MYFVKGDAVPNPEQVESLRILAQQAGAVFHYDDDVGKDNFEENIEGCEKHYCRAFLPLRERVWVYMSECLSPSHFYVHIVCHMASLRELD